uniref:Uncharacterized protein n=1 Tax=Saccharum officinarum TaxID=4547 RepID=A0A678TAG8_SACOF|nr:hypothetical protein SO89O17_000009 [Saccharum officinarum]
MDPSAPVPCALCLVPRAARCSRLVSLALRSAAPQISIGTRVVHSRGPTSVSWHRAPYLRQAPLPVDVGPQGFPDSYNVTD